MRRSISAALCPLLVVTVLASACRGYSRHPVDSKPQEEIDERLLGKWRPLEDPDTENYVLVKTVENIHVSKSREKHSENWKKGDLACDRCFYSMTYFDYHGRNPLFGGWEAFASKIKGNIFINLSYRDTTSGRRDKQGYLLLLVSRISPKSDTVSISVVGDPQITDLQASQSVRNYVEQNVTNPMLYSRTLHFVRLKSDGR